MPRYLITANYSAEGARALMAGGGSARRTAVEKMVAGLGGRMETLDFAFGGEDVYTIVEMPDNVTAAAVALTVSGSGSVQARTIVLLTPEEIDRAAELSPEYAAPGTTG